MATIAPPTGGTIQATTIEGQLFQLIHWIEIHEKNSAEDTRFTFNKTENANLEGNFTLPALFIRNGGDRTFSLSAGTYPNAPIVPFNGGSAPGFLPSTTTNFAQYFLWTFQYALCWQQNRTKNPENKDYLKMSLNLTELNWEGEFFLPYTYTLLAGGGIQETATEWLLA